MIANAGEKGVVPPGVDSAELAGAPRGRGSPRREVARDHDGALPRIIPTASSRTPTRCAPSSSACVRAATAGRRHRAGPDRGVLRRQLREPSRSPRPRLGGARRRRLDGGRRAVRAVGGPAAPAVDAAARRHARTRHVGRHRRRHRREARRRCAATRARSATASMSSPIWSRPGPPKRAGTRGCVTPRGSGGSRSAPADDRLPAPGSSSTRPWRGGRARRSPPRRARRGRRRPAAPEAVLVEQSPVHCRSVTE